MPKKRKSPQRELKPRLHIFCEGEKTEPNYLNEYIERCFPGTTLTLVRKTEKNTPVQLVEVAIREKSRKPPDDQFWVVYDRESSVKYSDSLHSEACDKAEANGIGIAFSNVCFEVWLLLHFQETVAAYDSYADLRKRSRLKTHIKNYDKGAKRQYTEDEVSTARKNAVRLNKQTIAGADSDWIKSHQWNPYTNVHELLDEMDAHEEKYALPMEVQSITTEVEYKDALMRVDVLMDAIPGSPEEVELDMLARLIEVYEHEHYPIDV